MCRLGHSTLYEEVMGTANSDKRIHHHHSPLRIPLSACIPVHLGSAQLLEEHLHQCYLALSPDHALAVELHPFSPLPVNRVAEMAQVPPVLVLLEKGLSQRGLTSSLCCMELVHRHVHPLLVILVVFELPMPLISSSFCDQDQVRMIGQPTWLLAPRPGHACCCQSPWSHPAIALATHPSVLLHRHQQPLLLARS